MGAAKRGGRRSGQGEDPQLVGHPGTAAPVCARHEVRAVSDSGRAEPVAPFCWLQCLPLLGRHIVALMLGERLAVTAFAPEDDDCVVVQRCGHGAARGRQRPLQGDALTFVLTRHWRQLGLALDRADFTDTQAMAAISRITRGNCRLLQRLCVQMERILQINELQVITEEVVEAARSTLVIGAT
jgi:hypothetical protein